MQASVEEQTYVIHDEEIEWRHEEFSVVTQPIEHNLCGDLKYEVTFRGFLLTPSSQPLRYQDQLRSLAFFSNDYKDNMEDNNCGLVQDNNVKREELFRQDGNLVENIKI